MSRATRLAGVCLMAASIGQADTLLILPFANGSANPSLDWVGESIAETIREALAGQGLMTHERRDRQEVYRRLGVRPYAQLTRATVIKIGQTIDAERVIYGEFDLKPPSEGSASRGSLRITAHILDLRGMMQGPEFAEIGALEDLASLQRHLAWQTLQFIAPKNSPSETQFLSSAAPIRVDALENYIRGLLAASDEQKIRLFMQAIRLQPEYSQAQFHLGMLYFGKKDYRAAADWLTKVAATDVNYRRATFYLGLSRYYSGDFVAAQEAFEQVAKTVPLNEVLNNLGAAQSRRNLPQALDNFAKALEGDVSDPVYHFNVGYAFWKQGNFEAAAERFRAALDRDPNDGQATLMLGRCIKKTPFRPADSRENLERLKTNYEESGWWQLKAVLEPDKR